MTFAQGFALACRYITVIVLTQFLASLIVDHMDDARLEKGRKLLRIHRWERGGETWQAMLRVKNWKALMPEMGSNTPSQFRKTRMEGTKPWYLYHFVLETVRAELCHELALVFGLLVLHFCPQFIGRFFLYLYVVGINMPFIIIQRYNRPRFEHLLGTVVSGRHGVLIPSEKLYK